MATSRAMPHVGCISVTASVALWLSSASVHASGPYSIDDQLRLEMIGMSAASPDARWLVWEQSPPYHEIGDYSVPIFGAWNGSGYRLMALDLSETAPRARPLIEHETRRSYWLDSFSPDGRFVLFHTAASGVYSVGVYDTLTRRESRFAFAPRLPWSDRHRSVWVSSEEFVLAAHAPGDQPPGAARPHTGRTLWEKWQSAWRGGLSVDEVLSGGESQSATPFSGQLLRVNARVGEVTVLSDYAFESVTASPDGRYLAALRQFRRPRGQSGTTELDPLLTRSELNLFDLQVRGAARVIAGDKDVFPGKLSWSTDSSKLAYFAWDIGEAVRSGRFFVLDARSGEVTTRVHRGLELASARERGQLQQPERAIWIGDSLAVFGRRNPAGDAEPRLRYRDIQGEGTGGNAPKADWFLLDAAGGAENLTARFATVSAVPLFSDATSMLVLADGGVWRVRPGRAAVNLSRRLSGRLTLNYAQEEARERTPFERYIALNLHTSSSTGVAIVDALSGRVRTVDAPSPGARLLAVVAPGNAALFRQRTRQGLEIVLRTPRDRYILVSRLNTHLEDVTPTMFTTVRYEVRTEANARTVAACVIFPANYVRGRRYPTIVDVYPSRGASCANPENDDYVSMAASPAPYDLHLLAARGYVVFQPNTSRDLTQRPGRPLAGLTRAVEQGIDALVSQGIADSRRIGLIGFSQGGFAALWLATQSSRFKAVVSAHGWSDMYSNAFESTAAHRILADELPYLGNVITYESTEGSDFGIGQSPWDNPDAYVRQSPLFNARDVRAPIMLIHSDMDAFSLAQYEMMFTALNLASKQSRFLRFAGEGHGPSSPENQRYMWQSILGWFDEHLESAE